MHDDTARTTLNTLGFVLILIGLTLNLHGVSDTTLVLVFIGVGCLLMLLTRWAYYKSTELPAAQRSIDGVIAHTTMTALGFVLILFGLTLYLHGGSDGNLILAFVGIGCYLMLISRWMYHRANRMRRATA